MRIIYDQQNQWRDARRSLLYKSVCVCVCVFIFIPWLNSVKYRKCHKMSISQVYLFHNFHVLTNLCIYIYITWKYPRWGLKIPWPGPFHHLVPGCGYPKICRHYVKLKRPSQVQTNITGACLDGSTSLSSTTVPQKSAVGSTGSETWMQMADLVNRFFPTKKCVWKQIWWLLVFKKNRRCQSILILDVFFGFLQFSNPKLFETRPFHIAL